MTTSSESITHSDECTSTSWLIYLAYLTSWTEQYAARANACDSSYAPGPIHRPGHILLTCNLLYTALLSELLINCPIFTDDCSQISKIIITDQFFKATFTIDLDVFFNAAFV